MYDLLTFDVVSCLSNAAMNVHTVLLEIKTHCANQFVRALLITCMKIMLTLTGNLVSYQPFVFWHVNDAYDYHLGLETLPFID